MSRLMRSLPVVLALAFTAPFAALPQAWAQSRSPVLEAQPAPSLAPLVEAVTPAVVNISVVSTMRVEENPLYRDPFFPPGGESYVRGFFQATGVRRLRADLVLVLSARLGLSSTFGASQAPLLPLPERFFAGGDFGPRGFPVDGVGPQIVGTDGTLYPIGGNALLLGGAEMRYDLTRALQLASFLDLGNVYPESGDVALGDLRRSAGFGLRYRTPIGPIRLDWEYVLDRRPGEAASKFHLTIGHAF